MLWTNKRCWNYDILLWEISLVSLKFCSKLNFGIAFEEFLIFCVNFWGIIFNFLHSLIKNKYFCIKKLNEVQANILIELIFMTNYFNNNYFSPIMLQRKYWVLTTILLSCCIERWLYWVLYARLVCPLTVIKAVFKHWIVYDKIFLYTYWLKLEISFKIIFPMTI